MCIKFVTWRIRYFNTKRAILLSFMIISAFFWFNFHMIFSFKNDIVENNTFIDVCVNSKIMVSWFYVNIIDSFFVDNSK
jgi:hypothetical protein